MSPRTIDGDDEGDEGDGDSDEDGDDDGEGESDEDESGTDDDDDFGSDGDGEGEDEDDESGDDPDDGDDDGEGGGSEITASRATTIPATESVQRRRAPHDRGRHRRRHRRGTRRRRHEVPIWTGSSIRSSTVQPGGGDLSRYVGRVARCHGRGQGLAREVSDVLAEIRDDNEAAWIRRTDTGRFNVGRWATDPDWDADDVFDEFQAGAMDASSLDCVLVLDVSGSMSSDIFTLGEATWAIRTAIDKVEGDCTVDRFR